jgi:hypothetical protein
VTDIEDQAFRTLCALEHLPDLIPLSVAGMLTAVARNEGTWPSRAGRTHEEIVSDGRALVEQMLRARGEKIPVEDYVREAVEAHGERIGAMVKGRR